MIDLTRAYGMTFMFPQNDITIGRALKTYGEFARPEVELIIDHLGAAPAGTYVDVGANVGAMALPVAQRLPQVRVIAIEAQRRLAGILAANALNNQLFNIDVLHAAAGAQTGLQAFPQAPLDARFNFGMVGAAMTDLPNETVRVCTLDEAAPADARFVKIDVQTFEPEVLKGAAKTIRETRPAWLIEADFKANAANVRLTMKTMMEANYRLYWLFSPFVTPSSDKASPGKESLLGDVSYLALPEGMEPLWPMRRITDINESKPTEMSDFPYLRRFGYAFQG